MQSIEGYRRIERTLGVSILIYFNELIFLAIFESVGSEEEFSNNKVVGGKKKGIPLAKFQSPTTTQQQIDQSRHRGALKRLT